MKAPANYVLPSLAAAGVLLGACSTVTPDIHRPGQLPQKQWLSERKLIDHIQCQLGQAVRTAVKEDEHNVETTDPSYRATWLRDWGAIISLVIVVDDKAALTPAVTLNDPLENAVTVFAKNGNVTTPQNRGLGLGGTISSEAIRTETIGFFYSFSDLLDNKVINFDNCEQNQGLFLSSDLKIDDFIGKGMSIANTSGVLARKAGESPYQTFTYEVKFIVTEGASLTPAWKLLRVSTNQSGPLFSGTKLRTDDLTVTMGKVSKDNEGRTVPTSALNNQHLANLIGQAVANALPGRPLP